MVVSLLATAAHLLGAAGGIEPPIAVDELTSKIQSWAMHPRTLPDDTIRATAVALQGLERGNRDWLVLGTDSSGKLPAFPLRVEKERVKVGDTVHLIGCPYDEGDCKQNVYFRRSHETRAP